MSRPPFLPGNTQEAKYRLGMAMLLDWLEDQPGSTWQQRWLGSGIEQAGAAWRPLLGQWLGKRGLGSVWRVRALGPALGTVIGADILRPSVRWLTAVSVNGRGVLGHSMARCRDPRGFAQLREQTEAAENLCLADARLALSRAAIILAAKGGPLTDITVGDVLELFDAQAAVHTRMPSGTTAFYQLLRRLGALGAGAPESLREVRLQQQRQPEELVDRYGLVVGPVRDLLVDYLRERQPAMDYTSLKMLSYHLGKCFWRNIEHHHPGLDSLRLTPEVADAWKARLRTKTKVVTGPDGQRADIVVERISYRECLTAVRAFYLDLAQWALEDPGRWGPWVAPCPIREAEVSRNKFARRRKARIDARTRELLPVLPILVRTVDRHRKDTADILEIARRARPGEIFTAAGRRLVRTVVPTGTADKTWASAPGVGKRHDLGLEEERAFWTWAAVEVLRATGVRIEELLELSHHSLVQYRLPTTGELVPLLQIAPSKTDTERLLLVSPELADVLSTIICRVRDASGAIPLIRAYDRRENRWLESAPLLFQRPVRTENRRIGDETIRAWLARALTETGLIDPETGGPLHYTPHDFRRMFITDAIMSGLPPHIAQVIAGHRDVNVTLGYKAIYPEEAILAHRAFLERRRSLRPSEEYRVPTDDEWSEFLGHFERRKVSVGACGRAFGTPCIHEHACVRCPMLWPDPAQRERLVEIRDNLQARIAEAEREGWLGEVEGLQISLAGAEEKLAQLDRRPTAHTPVDLGIPTVVRLDGTGAH
ncbi:tyrosine-type recombinase/integrase (plasmid) [Embleya sp. NBC_00888]|uniref:tyrosine-type recombinase/integrase n=1 Tax=Embleya sp. NBC_00888 TaxID=2975960 RepID=UPI0038648AED|nr:tyrosine-type recombinase/integrase [Embleya sp. NBC_00888]